MIWTSELLVVALVGDGRTLMWAGCGNGNKDATSCFCNYYPIFNQKTTIGIQRSIALVC